MGLLELKTNLKSLKYQGIEKPLITKDINDPPKTGGISMQINHRIDDVARLGKLIVKKQGLKFLGNQALLAQTNIKQDIAAQKGKSAKEIAKAIGNRLKETVINTALATASIIAQAPLNGTGAHIPRGIKPVTHLKTGNQGGIATLAAPDGTIIPNGTPKDGLQSFIVDDNYQITNLGKTGDNKYNNGQKWISQFGAFQPSQANDYVNIQGSPTEIVKKGGVVGGAMTGTPTYKPLHDSELKDKETTTEISDNSRGKSNKDFSGVEKKLPQRLKSTPSAYKVSTEAPGADKSGGEWGSLTNPIATYNPGARRNIDSDGNISDFSDRPDPIQSIALDTAEITDKTKEDIIPFTFNVWSPNSYTGKFLYFRALLTSLSDNYSGNWNGNNFIGRGDSLYTYNNFERDISIAFKIAAFSKADLDPLYKKLNYLVGSTAPVYDSSKTFMKGTFVDLTIGDYIVKQSGFVQSIGLSWSTEYPWEVSNDDDMKRVPHILDVDVSFKPIHNFVPQLGQQFIYQDA